MARILTVCTANICRSAAAAALLTDALPSDTHVSSAGVAARDGHEMCSVTRQWLQDTVGADVGAGHRSRELTTDMIMDADLVLVASSRHRKLVLARAPRAAVFTVREAAMLTQKGPSARPDAQPSLGQFIDSLTQARHRTRFDATDTEIVTVERGDDKRRWFARSHPPTEISISPYDVPDAHTPALHGDHAPTFDTLQPAVASIIAALGAR